MFAWREPLSVSTRGRPNLRAELLQKKGHRQEFRLHVFVQSVELRLKPIGDLDGPSARSYYDIRYI
jgi:hypothetical protein